MNKRHGMRRTPTYSSWSAMMTRCYNKNHIGFQYWGGKGISVCESWHAFENFLSDMGERPQGTTIDRKDSNGHYEPTNCRWATPEVQNANKSNARLIEWQGEIHCVTEWSRILGVTTRTLFCRLNAGWMLDEIMTNGRREHRSDFIHPGSKKTTCKRGHPLSGENLRINKKGQRSCIICNNEMTRQSYLRRKVAA